MKGKRRIINFRNGPLCRTTLPEQEDSIDVSEFNLQKHIELLENKQEDVSQWEM